MIGKTEKIGAGGMGEVYLAHDTTLDRRVALKFLPDTLRSDAIARERFVREARAASRLTHSGIVGIHAVEEADGQAFISMEYVAGRSLRHVIDEESLPLDRAVAIASEVAGALSAAHAAGIVHRDIKPDNIVITEDGHAKVLDFGLARIEGATKLTESAVTVGTLAYMSPEQATGEAVDARTDIFSLGAVLYEMITAHTPFRGDHPAAVVYSIVNEAPEPLARYKSGVPEELQRIVEKALRKDRETRYQSALELVADLSALRSDSRVASTPAPRTRRRRLFPILAGIVVIAVAAVVLMSIRGWMHGRAGGSDHPRSLAVLHFKNLGAPGDDDYLAAGITEEVITDLAALPHLKVASRTAIDRYRGKEIDPRQVGGELGVGYVLEGSIQHQGDELRVTAQLISTADGFHVWAKSYGGTMADIFAVQDSLAARIAEALRLVVGGTGGKVPQRWTQNPEAYANFLMGRESYFDFGYDQDYGSSGAKAMHWYEKAIALDPDYAPALAGMADLLSKRWMEGHRPPGALEEALALAKRAQAVDPQLDIALRAEGRVYEATEDFQRAREVLERALAANPGLGITYSALSYAYTQLGLRDEALDVALRGIRADPSAVQTYVVAVGWYTRYGEYGTAERVAEEGLERFPDAPWLLSMRSNVLGAARRYEEQMATLQRLLAVQPQWTWRGAKEIGDCYLALHQPARADSVFRSILQHRPDLPNALTAVGEYELGRGRAAAAESLFTRASTIDPDFYPARLNLAHSIAAAGRKDEAERVALDLAARWPDDALVCVDICVFLRSRLRRFDAAEEWANRAVRLDPQSEEAQRQLAWTYYAKSEYDKAIETFQTAIRLRPDAWWDYLGMCRAQGGAGHVQEAIAAAERAVELRPNYIEGLMALGYWYSQAGNRHRAATSWEGVVALDSTHSGALGNLGIIYSREGKLHKALEMFEKAARIDSTNWNASLNVAGSALDLGELDTAREAALSAIARANGELYREAFAYEMLGRVDERAGREQAAASDYREGLERIERALRDQPENPDVVKIAGFLCVKTGDIARAREYATWIAEKHKESNTALYDAACIMALTGEREHALDYLESAVAGGFDDEHQLSTDRDLESLRDDPRFKKLVDGLK